jgi:hypothetical protein
MTPSDFYKMRRPEYFSDTELAYDVKLPREHFAYELSQITTNQKQDQFETFCRRLAEKFISPNLIPQVGPTGGGDGKTDFETYPVSNDISCRWFIPENGWNKDEKWAFAISAKADWNSKLKGDVLKIIETKREYTRIYFMTNQTPSSKKKKDVQDELKSKFNIEILILDGEWILEKVYSNDLIDLVVDSLNLSEVYKNRTLKLGSNDAIRIKRLSEVEKNIETPNRYFEYDFQIVEDALESTILTRMLEKPREEVEGKFDRAFRFCKKVGNPKQLLRLHYQRAWTYFNWYDDYASFIEEYKHFKDCINQYSSIYDLELYANLFNLLRGLSTLKSDALSDLTINLLDEKNIFYDILSKFAEDELKPYSSLVAKSYKSFQGIMDSITENKNPSQFLIEISTHMRMSEKCLEYPFDSFKKVVEELGHIFPDSQEFDNLIDIIASISERRVSELSAGEVFLKRGIQKLFADKYKASVTYFGKAVLKLAKEESQDGMYLSLIGLSQSYNALGLIWASNNCLITAISISFKEWHEKGFATKRIYDCAYQLSLNELVIGRIPSFLIWYELFQIISKQLDKIHDDNISPEIFIDGLFSVRILNTNNDSNHLLSCLPDVFSEQSLWISQNSCLYKLGYTDAISDEYINIMVDGEQDLDKHFEMIASQPFKQQILHETNFVAGETLKLSSRILGCEFNVYLEKDKNLLLDAEALLAFFESFLSTSLSNVYPSSESIDFKIIKDDDNESIDFVAGESSHEYLIKISQFGLAHNCIDNTWKKMLEFVVDLLRKNFFLANKNIETYLENLFESEDLNERVSLIFNHRKLTLNTLGHDPKLFINDWIEKATITEYPIKRDTSVLFEGLEVEQVNNGKLNQDQLSHDKIKVSSIFDINLWEKAKWSGFGFFADPISMGIIIAYENEDAGRKIFDNWIQRIGEEDIGELIRITIVKGVDRNNPFWYRIHISSNIDWESLKQNRQLFLQSRIHEMNANKSENLDNLIREFKEKKEYMLCSAKIMSNGKIQPFFDKSIIKRSLIVKNAWEIGENDLDRVVIRKDDSPIIPDNIEFIPVLKLLDEMNK